MMKKIILHSIAVSLFLNIISCGLLEPPQPQRGNLSLTFQYPEPAGEKLSKANTLIDRVHVGIYNSNQQSVYDRDLEKTGSTFSGTIELAVGSGYSVTAQCYYNSALAYQGSRSNISIQGGKRPLRL